MQLICAEEINQFDGPYSIFTTNQEAFIVAPTNSNKEIAYAVVNADGAVIS